MAESFSYEVEVPSSIRRSAIRFSAGEDVLLLKEVLANNPFGLPHRWAEIADTMKSHRAKPYTPRNVKERVDYILKIFIKGERDILKKSGTEEEYSERESLLEEVKSLKESTPLVPTGKRTIMDRRRDEGKKLRANAAAVLSEEVTDNSMVEEIYTRDENINFEWYDSSPTESGACAAAEEVVNTPIVNANSGVSYLVQSPEVNAPTPGMSTAPVNTEHSLPINTYTPRSTYNKNKAAFNKAIMEHMERKKENDTLLKIKTIELELIKAENERKRMEIEEIKLNKMDGLEKQINNIHGILQVLSENQVTILSLLNSTINKRE